MRRAAVGVSGRCRPARCRANWVQMNELQIQALDTLLDDHYALWDFADSFPKFHPAATDSRLEDLIKLVESGLVVITFGRWLENDTASISPDEARSVLRYAGNWQPTGREPGYALELTAPGRDLLHSIGIWLGSPSRPDNSSCRTSEMLSCPDRLEKQRRRRIRNGRNGAPGSTGGKGWVGGRQNFSIVGDRTSLFAISLCIGRLTQKDCPQIYN